MRFVALVLFAAGCTDGDIDLGNDDDGFQQVDNDGDGVPDPLGEPDETLTGDLSTGSVISIDWADDSGFFCWPSTENGNFDGAHVIFEIEKQGSGNMVIQVDPADGVDVSIYTLEYMPDSVATPPDVSGAPSRCEASADQTNDSNPGATEVIGPLVGFADRVVVLGVAGANGTTSGAFTVGVWRLDGGQIDDGDTGP
jgi:hypothetical protein